jgi:hypothetical protein
METYQTEMDLKRCYRVKVLLSDGKVGASGSFSTLELAHEWIDIRRKRNTVDPEIAFARARALQDLRW